MTPRESKRYVTLGVRVPQEHLQELNRIAAGNDRTLSAEVRRLIRFRLSDEDLVAAITAAMNRGYEERERRDRSTTTEDYARDALKVMTGA